MSSYLNVRQEFVTALETDWPVTYPGKPIYYSNGPAVDPAQQGDLYLDVHLHFNDADLGNIGSFNQMGYSFSGSVLIEISVPLGSGLNLTYGVADFLVNSLKARSFTSFFVSAPVLLDSVPKFGRCVTTLMVPIRSHVA